MSSFKFLVKKRIAEHYFESKKNLNLILFEKTFLVNEKKMFKKVWSCRLKYRMHLLKQIQAKWSTLMGFFKQARLVEKFSPFLSLLGKH